MPVHFRSRAHYLRLLTQTAEFYEFKNAEESLQAQAKEKELRLAQLARQALYEKHMKLAAAVEAAEAKAKAKAKAKKEEAERAQADCTDVARSLGIRAPRSDGKPKVVFSLFR